MQMSREHIKVRISFFETADNIRLKPVWQGCHSHSLPPCSPYRQSAKSAHGTAFPALSSVSSRNSCQYGGLTSFVFHCTISETDGEVCLKISKDNGKAAEELLQMLTAWQEQAAKLTTEEISREEYDQWRYNYPKFDTTQQWANVPSKELSDALVKTFKDKLKTD